MTFFQSPLTNAASLLRSSSFIGWFLILASLSIFAVPATFGVPAHSGQVVAWGENRFGLGTGNASPADTFHAVPVQVVNPDGTGAFSDIDGISTGLFHIMAVKADGSVWGWGNSWGSLLEDSNLPDAVLQPLLMKGPNGKGYLTDVAAISASMYQNLALKKDGTVWRWPSYEIGWAANYPAPVKGPDGIGVLSDVVAIANNYNHSLALKMDGTVWAWGENSYGQLGNFTASGGAAYPVPVLDVQGKPFQDAINIAAGYNVSLILRRDGTVWVWGMNQGWPTELINPETNAPFTDVIAVTGSEWPNLILRKDGTVWAWGYNNNGELGNSAYSNFYQPIPSPIPGPDGTGRLKEIIAIAAGLDVGYALDKNGTVWAWGRNDLGQLGRGILTSSPPYGIPTPAPVKGLGGEGVLAPVVGLASSGQSSFAMAIVGSNALSDLTPPITTASVSQAANESGWNNGDVKVHLQSSDPGDNETGVASVTTEITGDSPTPLSTTDGDSADVIVSAEGENRVIYFSIDKTGNSELRHSLTLRIDKTAPRLTATAISGGKPYQTGNVTNRDVQVSFQCADDDSGVDSFSAPVTVTQEGENQSVTGACTDLAGNRAEVVFEGISINKTPPSTVANVEGIKNDAGWYKQDVLVTLEAKSNNSSSSVASLTFSSSGAQETPKTTVKGATATYAVHQDGETTLSFFATDNAGNQETPKRLVLKLDKTPPILSVTATSGGQPYQFDTWTNQNVILVFECNDATSGVQTLSVPYTITTEGANQAASGTCTDRAGNQITTLFGGINISSRFVRFPAIDLNRLLQVYLGLREPTPDELAAWDVRPVPGVGGRPYGDGQLKSDDINALFRSFLGYEIIP